MECDKVARLVSSHLEDLREEDLEHTLWYRKVDGMSNGFFTSIYDEAMHAEESARYAVNRLIPEANIPKSSYQPNQPNEEPSS